MRNKTIVAASVAIAVVVSACQGGYAGSDYRPVVDVDYTASQQRVAPHEAHAKFERDLDYCQSLADQRSVLTAGGQSGLAGGLVGLGGGALAGALRGGGNVAEGALIGGALGLGTAAAYGGMQGNTAKQDIVIGCLRKRGHDVVAR